MKIRNDLGDQAVLAELGQRLSHRRVEAGLTQEKLARESGVSKRTVERLEAGSSVQLTSLIRLLRTLTLLDGLETVFPPATPGPMELLERGRTRQRVRQKTGADGVKEPGREYGRGRWKWDDHS